ncbi:MAG: single-stranded-DNA-specific exonuclease RecJ [Deltaproteobacteria bacterium]|nr:single-stranded-DNA-specific exonuclease RecJ [Deltaproteobacteria bacterium]
MGLTASWPKRRWVMRQPDPASVETLCAAGQSWTPPVSPLLAILLLNRGVDSPERAAAFLSPTLRSGLRSPLLFPDMARATERILRARKQGERVCIYGDYDVDGVTGSSQLLLFLRELGMVPDLYIPHRTREGYGLNSQAMRTIAERGTTVMVTADCGATAHSEIALAQSLGIDVIVCDHHHVPEQRLPAYAVLNPMEKACPFSFSGLSGAGVVFYLLMGLRMRLREQGQEQVPDLRRYLDLVTLGTVADLVPLVEENRVLVTHGLKEIERSQRPGIRALKEVSGDAEVSSSYIGFRLGPRINAGGRLAEAQKAVELLTTEDSDRARELAADLDRENRDRQGIEEAILLNAVATVESWPDLPQRRSIVLSSAEWHPGVIGIVASRLVERFHRPTFLIAIDGEKGKGSGRSPKVFHLYEGLQACAEWLDGYGGHRQAAGLSIQAHRVDSFAAQFEATAQARLTAEDLIPETEVDAEVDLSTLNGETMAEVRRLEPYGQGNPDPIFLVRQAQVVSARIVGGNSLLGKAGHLKLLVRSAQGGRPVDAIGFGMADAPIVQGGRLDLLYTPEINVWNGNASLQLRLRDLQIVH